MIDVYAHSIEVVEAILTKRKKDLENSFRNFFDSYKGGKGDDFSAPLVPTEPKSPTNLGGYKKLE